MAQWGEARQRVYKHQEVIASEIKRKLTYRQIYEMLTKEYEMDVSFRSFEVHARKIRNSLNEGKS
ncbi:MAG: hypothetical protein ABJN40_22960 [Sneathiella sp.]